MNEWLPLHPNARPDMLGFLPEFLNAADPRPAREQIHENYQHGGGWRSFNGFTMAKDGSTLSYPGDPPLRAIAHTYIRNERVILYENSWVAILQRDGSFEIARID